MDGWLTEPQWLLKSTQGMHLKASPTACPASREHLAREAPCFSSSSVTGLLLGSHRWSHSSVFLNVLFFIHLFLNIIQGAFWSEITWLSCTSIQWWHPASSLIWLELYLAVAVSQYIQMTRGCMMWVGLSGAQRWHCRLSSPVSRHQRPPTLLNLRDSWVALRAPSLLRSPEITHFLT